MQQLAALRKKREDAAVVNTKPQFGPVPSKAIFERKWLTKLNDHSHACPARYIGFDYIKERFPHYLFISIDLVTTFQKEAYLLGFDPSDFTPTAVFRDGSKPYDHVFVNSFDAATFLEGTVNDHVHESLAGDDSMLHGWTELQKERLQEEFEDLRVRIFELLEAGMWRADLAKEAIAKIEREMPDENLAGSRRRSRWR